MISVRQDRDPVPLVFRDLFIDHETFRASFSSAGKCEIIPFFLYLMDNPTFIFIIVKPFRILVFRNFRFFSRWNGMETDGSRPTLNVSSRSVLEPDLFLKNCLHFSISARNQAFAIAFLLPATILKCTHIPAPPADRKAGFTECPAARAR